jgi:hypothetical protein
MGAGLPTVDAMLPGQKHPGPQSVVIMQCLPSWQSESDSQRQCPPQSIVPPHLLLEHSALLVHGAPAFPPPELHAPTPMTTAAIAESALTHRT